MPNINQDLVGKVFGHLTVLRKAKERGKYNEYKWVCRCDCGKLTTVTTAALNSGSITSCGHVRLEKSKENLSFTEDRHKKQFNNRLPVTNKTGYKNISMTTRNGRERYRVAIQVNRKQHSKIVDSLEEALVVREQLRKEWWPK
ncbi:hypothetical protein [Limosilactobacillus antri]|uniref:hypothetical protein n=1 Tax=Limosilactobacillus antri TaxID=227943 RepID=UPI001F578AFF|nr:hypothetical protein [Limosilactobacillus antri]